MRHIFGHMCTIQVNRIEVYYGMKYTLITERLLRVFDFRMRVYIFIKCYIACRYSSSIELGNGDYYLPYRLWTHLLMKMQSPFIEAIILASTLLLSNGAFSVPSSVDILASYDCKIYT